MRFLRARLGFVAKELEWHRIRYFEWQRAEVECRSVKLEINPHVLTQPTAKPIAKKTGSMLAQ